MEALNSVESRKLTAIESMQRLELAILHSDQRCRIRRDLTARAQLAVGFTVLFPFSLYFMYNLLHANGVMHNHKSAAGNYMYWPQNFMYTFKPQTQIWRPEFYNRESQTSLQMYSRKIQRLRKLEDNTLTAGVHYPVVWH